MSNNYIDLLIQELKDLINKSSTGLRQDKLETFKISCQQQCDSYKKLLSIKNDIDLKVFDRVLYKIEFNLAMIYLTCTENRSFTIDNSKLKDLATSIDNSKGFIDHLCSNDLAHELDRGKIHQIGFLYLKLSELYMFVSNVPSRLKCIQTAYDILNGFNDSNDNSIICKLLITLATTTNRFGLVKECKQYTLAVEERMKYLKDYDLKAKIYSDLSTIYVKESYDKSIKYLEKALELTESFRIRSIVYQNIGATNNIYKHYEKALDNSRSSESCIEAELKRLETVSDLTPEKLQRERVILRAQMSNVYFNIGYSNAYLKNNKEAVKYFEKSHKKAVELINIKFFDNVVMESLEALAAVQATNSNYSLSKEYLERARHLLIKTINPNNTVLEQRLSRKIKDVSALENTRHLRKHEDESTEDTQRETESKESQENGDDDDDDDDDDEEEEDDDDDEETETEIETQKTVKMKGSSKDRFGMVSTKD